MAVSRSPASSLAVLAAARPVATASIAQDKTDGLWRGTGGAALSVTSGNCSTRSVLLSADAVRATTADRIALGAMANNARNTAGGADQTTADRWAEFGQ